MPHDVLLDASDLDGLFHERTDAGMIQPPRQRDPVMDGWCELAYGVLVAAFTDTAAIARREGLNAALMDLARLRVSEAMRTWADVLGMALDRLCDGVGQRLTTGEALHFERLCQATEENARNGARR